MSRLNRPEFPRMTAALRNGLAVSFGKLIAALFIFQLLQAFVMVSGTYPMTMFSGPGLPVLGVALSVCSLFVCAVVSGLLSAGLMEFATNVARRKPASVTMFFSAFLRRDARFVRVASASTLIHLAAAAAMVTAFLKIPYINENIRPYMENGFENSDMHKVAVAVCAAAAVYSVTHLLLSLPFAFTWNILGDFPSVPAMSAMKKSFILMMPNYLHFILFCIVSVIKNVAVIALIIFASRLQFMENLKILQLAMNFLLFIQQYTVVAKLVVSVPVYYYSLLSANDMIPERYTAKSVSIIVDDEDDEP